MTWVTSTNVSTNRARRIASFKVLWHVDDTNWDGFQRTPNSSEVLTIEYNQSWQSSIVSRKISIRAGERSCYTRCHHLSKQMSTGVFQMYRDPTWHQRVAKIGTSIREKNSWSETTSVYRAFSSSCMFSDFIKLLSSSRWAIFDRICEAIKLTKTLTKTERTTLSVRYLVVTCVIVISMPLHFVLNVWIS